MGAFVNSLPAGATLAIVSTVSPDTVRRVAEAAPEGAVLDAPVMGSPSVIAAGMGSFLIGGPSSSVTSLDALWTDLGAGYRHCGPVGSGATMKLVSNLLLITGVAALAEAIATARHHGIPDDLLQSLFAESFVVSPASKVRLEIPFRRGASRMVLSVTGTQGCAFGRRPCRTSSGRGTHRPGHRRTLVGGYRLWPIMVRLLRRHRGAQPSVSVIGLTS